MAEQSGTDYKMLRPAACGRQSIRLRRGLTIHLDCVSWAWCTKRVCRRSRCCLGKFRLAERSHSEIRRHSSYLESIRRSWPPNRRLRLGGRNGRLRQLRLSSEGPRWGKYFPRVRLKLARHSTDRGSPSSTAEEERGDATGAAAWTLDAARGFGAGCLRGCCHRRRATPSGRCWPRRLRS